MVSGYGVSINVWISDRERADSRWGSGRAGSCPTCPAAVVPTQSPCQRQTATRISRCVRPSGHCTTQTPEHVQHTAFSCAVASTPRDAEGQSCCELCKLYFTMTAAIQFYAQNKNQCNKQRKRKCTCRFFRPIHKLICPAADSVSAGLAFAYSVPSPESWRFPNKTVRPSAGSVYLTFRNDLFFHIYHTYNIILNCVTPYF